MTGQRGQEDRKRLVTPSQAHEQPSRRERAWTRDQPWKSGASAPPKSYCAAGFSPRILQGLKAVLSDVGNAALEGPLFHGAAAVCGHVLLILSMFNFLGSLTLGQVTPERLVNSAKEPQNWLTYSGDYAGRRFTALDQVNAANAHALAAKWVYQTGATGKLETTPLVVDGILYATAQDDRAFALDARTGRPIWMYQHQLPADIRPCCGHVNRGLAILGVEPEGFRVVDPAPRTFQPQGS